MTKAQRTEQIRFRLTIILFSMLTIICSIPIGTKVYAEMQGPNIKPEYVRYCEDIGEEMGICPELLVALIESESGGNPNDVSEVDAVGLTQVIPKYSKYSRAELFDPYTNIKAGAEILLDHCEQQGDIGLALVAYNCGAYSKTLKNCKENGTLTKYAEKILARSYQLERYNGK